MRISLPALLLCLCAFPILAVHADGSEGRFRYPLPQISDPACRFSAWGTLDDDCKIDLPRIEGADYARYKDNFLYERVYTVLWEATYDYGWDVGQGSHMGVDIATSLGTPVVAIGDGEVLVAGWLSGWGNTVSIKHTLDDGTAIYSNYSHLSTVSVKVGDKVRWGDRVGAVGSTGNSTGNHLHFQIDTKKWFHPWYFTGCGKGVGEWALVNDGLCHADLEANTLDPIAFLESGKLTAPVISEETIEDIAQAPAPEIQQEEVRSREEIVREELGLFLKRYEIRVAMSADRKTIPLGGQKTAKIVVTERRNKKPFTGTMPIDGIELHVSGDGVRPFPSRILDIQDGERAFSLEGKKTGSYVVSLRIGTEILAVVSVQVYDPKTEASPVDGSFFLPSKPTLGDERTVGFIMRTSLGGYSLGIPYGDRYILRAKSGKAKFCNVSNKTRKACSTGDLVTELSFTYADTYRGVLLARAVPLAVGPLSYELVRSDGRIIATSADMSVGLPSDLASAALYRAESLRALERGLFRTSSGKLLPGWELRGKQAKEVVENSLGYAYLRAWDDRALKAKLLQLRTAFASGKWLVGDYELVTRARLARLLMDAFRDPRDAESTGRKWRDESGDYEPELRTLRVRDAFAWRDSFGDRYFQSDKTITVEEALYLADYYLGTALARYGVAR